ncbi:MAG: hypothetical protein AB8I58_18475, partial [Anaerolineales bacterium]
TGSLLPSKASTDRNLPGNEQFKVSAVTQVLGVACLNIGRAALFNCRIVFNRHAFACLFCLTKTLPIYEGLNRNTKTEQESGVIRRQRFVEWEPQMNADK